MRSIRGDLDSLHPLGDVSAALRAGRQQSRHNHWRDIAALLGSAAAAATVVGGAFWIQRTAGGDEAPPAASKESSPAAEVESVSPDDPITVGDEIRTIFPITKTVGAPAPAGSLLAHACEATSDCEWVFASATKETLPLAEVSSSLNQLLADVDAGEVSISYDGQWMSIDFGAEIRVQSLNPDIAASDPLVLRPAANNLEWDLVAWGGGSLSASFAEVNSDGIANRYARVDLLTGDLDMVTAPLRNELGPVGDGGDGPQVETRFDPRGERPVTGYRTAIVNIVDDESAPRGEVLFLSDTPLDLSGVMARGETLVGPDGLLEVRNPPGGDVVWPHVTVFANGPAGLVRSGVIEAKRDGPVRLGRWEGAPESQVLGTNRAGSVVERFSDRVTSTVLARSGDETTWIQSMPGDVDWVVPGLALGN